MPKSVVLFSIAAVSIIVPLLALLVFNNSRKALKKWCKNNGLRRTIFPTSTCCYHSRLPALPISIKLQLLLYLTICAAMMINNNIFAPSSTFWALKIIFFSAQQLMAMSRHERFGDSFLFLLTCMWLHAVVNMDFSHSTTLTIMAMACKINFLKMHVREF